MLLNLEALSADLNVTSHCPLGRSEAHLTNKNGRPVALVNLRPFFNINIIHFSLFARIKKLQERGVNVVLVLYDNAVIFGELSEEIQTEADSVDAMDYIYDAIQRFGVDTNALEVIPESVIWKCTNYNSNILGNLIKLTYSVDGHKHLDELSERRELSYYLDVMLGITYEGLLKPDFVFFSGKEVEALKQVRARTTLSNLYGNNFIPPIILNIPDISKYNSGELISTKDTDDLFSKAYQIDDLTTCLQSCSEQYIKTINILSDLENLDSKKPEMTIGSIRRRMYV